MENPSDNDPSFALQILTLGDQFVLTDGNRELLGKSLRELLTLAIATGRAGDWQRARRCCEAGKRVMQLEPEYRGRINLKLAAGIVDFYLGTAMLGMEDWENAPGALQEAGDRLSFIAPMAGAAAWLAVARIHTARGDPFGSLWALQKSWNLIEDQNDANAEPLRGLIQAEYDGVRSAIG